MILNDWNSGNFFAFLVYISVRRIKLQGAYSWCVIAAIHGGVLYGVYTAVYLVKICRTEEVSDKILTALLDPSIHHSLTFAYNHV